MFFYVYIDFIDFYSENSMAMNIGNSMMCSEHTVCILTYTQWMVYYSWIDGELPTLSASMYTLYFFVVLSVCVCIIVIIFLLKFVNTMEFRHRATDLNQNWFSFNRVNYWTFYNFTMTLYSFFTCFSLFSIKTESCSLVRLLVFICFWFFFIEISIECLSYRQPALSPYFTLWESEFTLHFMAVRFKWFQCKQWKYLKQFKS